MSLKPFIRLAQPRIVSRPDLPKELAEFYTWNEGIGLERDPEATVGLCKLDELSRIDLHQLGYRSVPPAWNRFEAIYIGWGISGECVTCVLSCPSAPPGSILAFGDHCIGWGGGGEGPDSMESSLVLAPTFEAWLAHMERWGWQDPILRGIGEWKGQEKQQLRAYYLMHNPSIDIDWPIE